MDKKRMAEAGPFEICTVRPPTENAGLTFRLTRNCYWYKCGFCPVYKTGLRFSRRGIDEVKEDVTRARIIDELLAESGVGPPLTRQPYRSGRRRFLAASRKPGVRRGIKDRERSLPLGNSPDQRMRWFSSWFVDYSDIDDCLEYILSRRLSGGRPWVDIKRLSLPGFAKVSRMCDNLDKEVQRQ